MSVMSFKIDQLYYGINKGNIESRNTLSISPQGVLNDYHIDSTIIMLDLDTYNIMLSHKDSALCMAKFYAHIIACNLDNIDLIVGDTLTNQSLELRVVKIGKDCHIQEGCGFDDKTSCQLKDKTYYLTSLNSGEVKVNEKWEVIQCIDTPL
jgi:hypothetical protein